VHFFLPCWRDVSISVFVRSFLSPYGGMTSIVRGRKRQTRQEEEEEEDVNGGFEIQSKSVEAFDICFTNLFDCSLISSCSLAFGFGSMWEKTGKIPPSSLLGGRRGRKTILLFLPVS